MSAPRTPAPSSPGRWFAIAATVAVVATLVAAFMVMRSPGEQRKVSLDQRRVQDLAQLGHAIDAYATLRDALPPDLDTLARQPGSVLPMADPVTGAAYGYEPGADRHYRLCAVFDTDTALTNEAMSYGPASWTHGAGRHCFERVAARQGASAQTGGGS